MKNYYQKEKEKRIRNWKLADKLMKEDWGDKTLKVKLPFSLQVIAQTKEDKEKAKFMTKLLNFQYSQIYGSKILKTLWGTLMWIPKKLKKEYS